MVQPESHPQIAHSDSPLGFLASQLANLAASKPLDQGIEGRANPRLFLGRSLLQLFVRPGSDDDSPWRVVTHVLAPRVLSPRAGLRPAGIPARLRRLPGLPREWSARRPRLLPPASRGRDRRQPRANTRGSARRCATPLRVARPRADAIAACQSKYPPRSRAQARSRLHWMTASGGVSNRSATWNSRSSTISHQRTP